jgi:hypothetical protein
VPGIKSDRPGGCIAALIRSDGVEVFDVYFAWKFRITDLPLFMISSLNDNYLG